MPLGQGKSAGHGPYSIFRHIIHISLGKKNEAISGPGAARATPRPRGPLCHLPLVDPLPDLMNVEGRGG